MSDFRPLHFNIFQSILKLVINHLLRCDVSGNMKGVVYIFVKDYMAMHEMNDRVVLRINEKLLVNKVVTPNTNYVISKLILPNKCQSLLNNQFFKLVMLSTSNHYAGNRRKCKNL